MNTEGRKSEDNWQSKAMDLPEPSVSLLSNSDLELYDFDQEDNDDQLTQYLEAHHHHHQQQEQQQQAQAAVPAPHSSPHVAQIANLVDNWTYRAYEFRDDDEDRERSEEAGQRPRAQQQQQHQRIQQHEQQQQQEQVEPVPIHTQAQQTRETELEQAIGTLIVWKSRSPPRQAIQYIPLPTRQIEARPQNIIRIMARAHNPAAVTVQICNEAPEIIDVRGKAESKQADEPQPSTSAVIYKKDKDMRSMHTSSSDSSASGGPPEERGETSEEEDEEEEGNTARARRSTSPERYKALKASHKGLKCNKCHKRREVAALCKSGHITCERCATEDLKCTKCKEDTYPSIGVAKDYVKHNQKMRGGYKCPSESCRRRRPKEEWLEHMKECENMTTKHLKQNSTTWSPCMTTEDTNEYMKNKPYKVKPHIIIMLKHKLYILLQLLKVNNEWKLRINYIPLKLQAMPPNVTIEVLSASGERTGMLVTMTPIEYEADIDSSVHWDMYLSIGRMQMQRMSETKPDGNTLCMFRIKIDVPVANRS